jgi:hypothetical protein
LHGDVPAMGSAASEKQNIGRKAIRNPRSLYGYFSS